MAYEEENAFSGVQEEGEGEYVHSYRKILLVYTLLTKSLQLPTSTSSILFHFSYHNHSKEIHLVIFDLAVDSIVNSYNIS